jgi:hypothetical protein
VEHDDVGKIKLVEAHCSPTERPTRS